MPDEDQPVIAERDMRTALERVLSGTGFRTSERLRRFLSYAVEETLAGRQRQLKGYSIGIEAFDKPEEFDPATDASVRVEAIRLRRALQTYYLTDGRDDPVVIDIPKGSYVPVFSTGPAAEQVSGPPVSPAPRNALTVPRSPAVLTIVAIVFVMAAAALAAMVWEPQRALSASFEDASALPTGPKIAVLPFIDLGPSRDHGLSTAGMAIQLTSDLSSFRDCYVIAENTVLALGTPTAAPGRIGRDLRADYVVSGSILHENETVRVTAQLTATRSERVLWSQSYDRDLGSGNLIGVLDAISGSIAGTLGQAYGVINQIEWQQGVQKTLARLQAHQGTRRPKQLSSYQCVLKFFDYAAGKDPEKHLRVRTCLLNALEAEPRYARAWAALSWIYADEWRLGFNSLPGDARERSFDAARNAVRYDPHDFFAHQYLATAYFLRGNDELFRQHARTALELNPNDADLLADIGWIASLLGHWKVGIPLAEKALRLNPRFPPWYQGILAMHHYRNGDYVRARDHADAYYQPDVLLSHIVRVASYARVKGDSRAPELLRELLDRFPGYPGAPRELMRQSRVPETLIDALLDGLRQAGLNETS